MLSEYSSNVILAKVRAMYGKRISEQDYKSLISCSTVADVAMYLKNHTSYAKELFDLNEREVHRGSLENLVKKKLFHDLESLCRYEISTRNSFAEYTIVRTEIEQIIHSLMYLVSGRPAEYIYSLPMFFNKRTKINLMDLASIKDYDDFLKTLEGSDYEKILKEYKPKKDEQLDISAIEKALYNYLYGKFFEALKKDVSREVRNKLSEIMISYIDYTNFVRIVRLKRNDSKDESAILDYGTLKSLSIKQMLNAKSEEEVFNIMKSTNRGKKLAKMQFNYIDELPARVMYDNCRKSIRFSINPSVVMLSYLFLLQIEISNLVTIIEGVHYKVQKNEIEKLLITKNQSKEGVI